MTDTNKKIFNLTNYQITKWLKIITMYWNVKDANNRIIGKVDHFAGK
jgi:hypothetical protein